jgi:nucleoside-diphosphate-sugar epimerase
LQIFITGGSGFIGHAVCTALVEAGHSVTCVARSSRRLPSGCQEVFVPSIGPETDWMDSLEGVEAVVHLAARAHVMREDAADPLDAFRQVNALGTLRLARAAAEAGVRRFVFLSSVKVNGDVTGDRPFTETDPADPGDPYASSKLEAEQGLAEIAGEGGMEIVVLRPPLVYGPGVKGNFLSLLQLCDRGLPLPLGGIANRRSLLSLDNLVDAIGLCLTHPAAAGGTYLLRDGEDLGTAELIRRLSAALGRPPRLFAVPTTLLKTLGRCLGRRAEMERLLGSLVVDDGKIRRELGWSPPCSLDQGFAATAVWFRECRPS